MNRFFGTFLSGAEKIVEAMLRRRLRDVAVVDLLDGAVEFETETPYSDLNLFCFNNLFLLLHKSRTNLGEQPLNGYLRELLAPAAQSGKGPDWAGAGKNSPKLKTFRVVTSQQNRLVAVDNLLRQQLEKRLSRASGLRVDRSRPDTEFWLLARSEGACYFLKRLSRHTAYDKLLHPGELHPELAYMMCWLTGPRHTDVVLDPFCGYGAIPFQRCRRFPYTRVYAFDKNEKVLACAREKLLRKPGAVTVENRDALRLSEALPAGSVDAVITDPPWGLYEDAGMPLSQFYGLALQQFSILLKPGGKLALLTAGKEEFLSALEARPEFALQAEYRILVSGKKCGLYLAEKSAEFPKGQF